MSDDLVTFLRARMDEDELWATEASRRGDSDAVPGGAHWQWVDTGTDKAIVPDPGRYEYVDEDRPAVALRSLEQFPTYSVGDLPQFAISHAEEVPSAVGGHIVRHDPAHVLAEVAAKRRIIAWHDIPARAQPGPGLREHDRWCVGCGFNNEEEPMVDDINHCPVLRALALPYAQNPDYRPEWLPDA